MQSGVGSGEIDEVRSMDDTDLDGLSQPGLLKGDSRFCRERCRPPLLVAFAEKLASFHSKCTGSFESAMQAAGHGHVGAKQSH